MFVSKWSVLKIVAFVCCYERSSGTCLEKFALSSVDALVRSKPNNRAVLQENVNFNSLDSFVSIDVISSNVSQLCTGMIKDFPGLKRLSLINANLSEIQPGVFKEVPLLEYVSLSVNHLTNVPRGVFDSVKSLKVIYLASNRIRSIEDGAFALMPVLEKVYLAHNQIAELAGNIFFGSTRLHLVDFSFNQLLAIEKNNFKDLKFRDDSSRRPTKILLQRNQIESVAREAFLDLRAVDLHLENNHISRLSQVVSGVPDGSKVFVSGNQIECIPDDVLERVRDGNVHLWAQENPMACECLKRVQDLLNSGIRGHLNVSTTLPCDVFSNFF